MTEPIQWDKHASLSCRKCGGNKLSGGAHDSLRVLRPDPPLLPSIIFPLGPPSCGDECRAERALGCGRIFPCGQQAGATVRKRRREGNARGGAGNDSGRESVHDTNLRSVGEQNRCQVGPTILFECPAPDPPLLPSIIFPLGHARAFISMTMTKIVNNEIILA